MLPLYLLLTFLVGPDLVRVRADEYVEEAQQQCSRHDRAYSCAKYRVLRYLETRPFAPVETGRGERLLRLARYDRGNVSMEMFANARQFPGDSEVWKFFKFLQRQAATFFNTQGVAIALPEEARLIEAEDATDEDDSIVDSLSTKQWTQRGGEKKKRDLLVPLVILFKLFKIKVLVALALGGIFFIKKTILLAALVAPSILHSIKEHCKTSYHVVPHYYSENVHHNTHSHEHAHDTSGGDFEYGGYNKDWDRFTRKHYPYT